jgi:hypothetical protein
MPPYPDLAGDIHFTGSFFSRKNNCFIFTIHQQNVYKLNFIIYIPSISYVLKQINLNNC